jgi:lactoylglutathione lyase
MNTMSSDAQTKGFRLTHVGLRVADIDRSVSFYSGVFGMTELGRMPLDTTTVVFLGYPDASSPQTPLFAREGVLELVCSKVTVTHQSTRWHIGG